VEQNAYSLAGRSPLVLSLAWRIGEETVSMGILGAIGLNPELVWNGWRYHHQLTAEHESPLAQSQRDPTKDL